MSRGRSKIDLAVGDTFDIPIGDGRFGAVRVVRIGQGDSGERTAMVATTTRLGAGVPRITEPDLRRVLRKHFGRFRGEPDIHWFDGSPTEEFVRIGTIDPSPDESSHDARGAFAGRWHVSMVTPVLLELDPASVSAFRSYSGNVGGSARVAAVRRRIADEDFWRVVGLIDWNRPTDEERIEPAIEFLSRRPEHDVAGFHESLCDKLFALDGEAWAREIGRGSFGSDRFSPDQFLYARCAVVSSGPSTFGAVLRDPTRMPKDLEFEALLTIAETAYRRKTGAAPRFAGDRDYETFANALGWKSP